MDVGDVVEAIFQRLCIRERFGRSDLEDRGMTLEELRLGLGATEAEFNEAVWLLSFPGDHRIEHPGKDRIALGTDWKRRCKEQETG